MRARESLHSLKELFASQLRLQGVALTERVAHAAANMLIEDAESDSAQGAIGCAQLREDLQAGALVVDHARDPAHLTLDAGEPPQQVRFIGEVARSLCLEAGHPPKYTPKGYLWREALAPGAGSRPALA